MTTKYGEFSISLPGPALQSARLDAVCSSNGNATFSDEVSVRSTQSGSVSSFEDHVTLEKSQCSYLELDVYGAHPRATATVAGKVLTENGQAVDRGAVFFINQEDTGPD